MSGVSVPSRRVHASALHDNSPEGMHISGPPSYGTADEADSKDVGGGLQPENQHYQSAGGDRDREEQESGSRTLPVVPGQRTFSEGLARWVQLGSSSNSDSEDDDDLGGSCQDGGERSSVGLLHKEQQGDEAKGGISIPSRWVGFCLCVCVRVCVRLRVWLVVSSSGERL